VGAGGLERDAGAAWYVLARRRKLICGDAAHLKSRAAFAVCDIPID